MISSPEFWANIKLLNQRLGYTRRVSKKFPEGGFRIPSVEDIKRVFKEEGLDHSRLVSKEENLTVFGRRIVDYMTWRAEALMLHVEKNLMNKDEAKHEFYKLKKALNPKCPLPMNKQKEEKRDYSFLTGIVNMLVEANTKGFTCDYDPKQLTAFTKNNFPHIALSRRVDGAFPDVIDPLAIWEIKEYYYTTTFGSRVADGVYETQLDGYELMEVRRSLNNNVKHYLFVDDHFTWWVKGRSYLCRLIDIMHMGLVDEVFFGREVIDRLPKVIEGWKVKNYKHQDQVLRAAEPDPEE